MPKKEQIPLWKELGFNSEYDFLDHKAKEEGYRSLAHKYTEQYAKQKGFTSAAELRKSIIEKAGFSSHSEYQDYCAKNMGFKSCVDYRRDRARKRGFKSLHDYYEWLAKKAGYESFSAYNAQLRLERNARQKGFKSHKEYLEHISMIEESIRLTKEDSQKKTACEFLKEKIAKNVDPNSLFAKGNIEFLRKITECPQLELPVPLEGKIPPKFKKMKK